LNLQEDRIENQIKRKNFKDYLKGADGKKDKRVKSILDIINEFETEG